MNDYCAIVVDEVEPAAGYLEKINYPKNKIFYFYDLPECLSENYYDCSSLVWRCYHSAGVNLGSDSYAPTAAEQGRWCAEHGKVLKYGAMDAAKMLPGDVICYSYNGENGRYRNISHIAMFVGYDEYGYAKVVEASTSNDTVLERYYYENDSTIQLIARPTK